MPTCRKTKSIFSIYCGESSRLTRFLDYLFIIMELQACFGVNWLIAKEICISKKPEARNGHVIMANIPWWLSQSKS